MTRNQTPCLLDFKPTMYLFSCVVRRNQFSIPNSAIIWNIRQINNTKTLFPQPFIIDKKKKNNISKMEKAIQYTMELLFQTKKLEYEIDKQCLKTIKRKSNAFLHKPLCH